MPLIRVNRENIDDRFSVLGFNIRSENPLYEVGVATDPALFQAENRSRRNRHNFFSSRSAGVLRAYRGEATYLVPPDVLANFVGQPRLYFGLATYKENSGGIPNFVQAPTEGNMYVGLSGLTERGLRRLAGRPSGIQGYGIVNGHDPSLDWGGDAQAGQAAGTSAAAPIQPGNGTMAKPANGSAAGAGTASTPAPVTAAQAYDDGFGPMPENAAEDADSFGIEEGIPDDGSMVAAAQSWRQTSGLEAPAPDYPAAGRFVPAHQNNYTAGRRANIPVDRIVIHITAGGPSIDGTINWFQMPDRRNERTGRPIRSSAHYIVGRDGEVVQMVRNADTSHHASGANWRSIGIEHNANKPSRGNPRKLDPTEPQYQASARLVAWLCQQFNLPADREHIVGHHEISPQDNHDCPSSIWDWDHYMDCVSAAAAALAVPAAQALDASRRIWPRSQEVIAPFYDPSDPISALTCQDDAFSQAREEWFMGVPDTRIFPHSAICQLTMTDGAGNYWGGTGFYIGPNRILTCAHNLHRMASVTIVPGKNGAGTDSKAQPFGSCTVQSSSWRVAPGYTGSGNWANDLAVIDNVPIAAPNGQWFEFLNATPSDRLSIVVCGYSGASDAVPELTQAIDGDVQHLHGGYMTEQSDLEMMEYPILTLHGASGSPVYHIDRNGAQPRALVCGVHVSGEPAAQGLNRGCFITPNKIDWIEGRARAFAMGTTSATSPTPIMARAKSDSTPIRTTVGLPQSRAQGMFDLLPVDLKLRLFIPAPAVIVTVPGIGGEMPGQSAHGGDGRGFQFEGGSSRAEITARFHFGGDSVQPSLSDITRSFGESTNYNRDDTVPVPGKPEWYRNLRPGAQPIEHGTQTVSDDKISVVMGGSSNDGIVSMVEHAVVVTFEVHASNPTVTGAPDIDATLAVLLKVDGDRIKVRVRGGHDEFPAYELYANGVLVYSYDPVAAGGTPWGLVGDGNWDVNPETDYVDVGPATEYRVIGPVHIGGTAQGLSASQGYAIPGRQRLAAPHAMAAENIEHAVQLIPQPNKLACWAASMAMLLSFRRNASYDPESLTNEVGGSLMSSYGWDLLQAVRDRYGFTPIEVPSNASLYFSPAQWAQWLRDYGPLWVVIVGMPHAVVVSGLTGDTDDPASCKVKVLNPWDTRVAFDNDPIEFHPANAGYTDWLPFNDFAADFGNMAEPDYGNWRVLYLPTSAATSQSLGVGARSRIGLPQPPRRVRAMPLEAAGPTEEPIEPSRIPGTTMSRLRGSANRVAWSLDQLSGTKLPDPAAAVVPAMMPTTINLDQWPYVGRDAPPLPLTVRFDAGSGAIGNVSISAGTAADLPYDVTVTATIEDDPKGLPSNGSLLASVKVTIDYDFSGTPDSDVSARVHLRLVGNGRFDMDSTWQ